MEENEVTQDGEEIPNQDKGENMVNPVFKNIFETLVSFRRKISLRQPKVTFDVISLTLLLVVYHLN